MLKKLRAVLVQSYVGAIGLGWLFAQGILHFTGIFSSPFASWLTRQRYRGLIEERGYPTDLSLKDSLPEALKSALILIVAYLLLRWLYYKPLPDAIPSSDAPAESQD